MLYKILDIGVSKVSDAQEREIYRVLNGSAVVFLPFVLAFFAFTYVYFPELIIYPTIAFISYIAAPVLNHFNQHTLARVIFVAVSPAVIVPCHLGFISENESLVTSIVFLQLIFTLHAWIIFRLEEWKYLVPVTFYHLALIVVYGVVEGYNHFEYGSEVVRSGWVQAILLTTDVLVIIFCIILLKLLNFNAVNKAKKLLTVVEESNATLQLNSDKLEQYLTELKEAQAADQQRQWQAEGINRIHNITRSASHEGSKVLDQVLAEIMGFLSANQGAIYRQRNTGEEVYLNMEAVYAYEKKKYLEKRIEIGQGLVGQCYLEREYIHLTEIPSDYLKITSGLGEALPRHLIIVPLIHNEEEVEGILELASFQPFEERHISYLTQLGSLLGSYLFNQSMNQDADVLNEMRQQLNEKDQEIAYFRSLLSQKGLDIA